MHPFLIILPAKKSQADVSDIFLVVNSIGQPIKNKVSTIAGRLSNPWLPSWFVSKDSHLLSSHVIMQWLSQVVAITGGRIGPKLTRSRKGGRAYWKDTDSFVSPAPPVMPCSIEISLLRSSPACFIVLRRLSLLRRAASLLQTEPWWTRKPVISSTHARFVRYTRVQPDYDPSVWLFDSKILKSNLIFITYHLSKEKVERYRILMLE